MLNLLHVLYVQFVVSDRKLFDFEICFQSVSNFVSSGLGDVAVENLQFDQIAVVLNKLGNSLGPPVPNPAIPQVKVL